MGYPEEDNVKSREIPRSPPESGSLRVPLYLAERGSD